MIAASQAQRKVMSDAIPISSAKLDELLARRRADADRIRTLEAAIETHNRLAIASGCGHWAITPAKPADSIQLAAASIVAVIIRDEEGKDWKWDGQDWTAVTASERVSKP